MNSTKHKIKGIVLVVIGILIIYLGYKLSISYGFLDTEEVIKEIRIPRALAAIVVGAALAISGAIMQGITRNPLASPTLLGLSSGASFMITLVMIVWPSVSFLGLSMASFLGSLLAVMVVYFISRFSPNGLTPVKLALAGTTISAFLGGITSIVGRMFNMSQNVYMWFSGGLSGVSMSVLKGFIPFIIIGIVLSIGLSRKITTLSFGEEVALNLGVNVNKVKLFSMIAVLFLVSAAVAMAGNIGFIGLMMPHIARKLVGQDYFKIIITSGILGSILLVYSDLISRMIRPPFETPVGTITSIIGVVFFLYLARKTEGGF
ncbi:FecCD family ABC transporter permease [Clostridium hydrogeniformans]|uniref:FecCD family ABC transporter permease n=1 Tax=Clostridium hydrogeniformans TaxID=349933 RepID=UPI000551E76F|nr:iron ABC transporter permease [Clostridium hydrogeniformans]